MSNADNAMFTDEAGNGIGDESVANTITKDSVVIGSEVENVNGNPDPNNSQKTFDADFEAMESESNPKPDAETTPKEGEEQLGEGENRYEHWQSKHDTLNTKFQAMESDYNAIKDMKPLLQYIQANPDILNIVDSRLSGGNNQDAGGSDPDAGTNKAPIMPKSPDGYNDVEAYNDPDSESFKHRVAMDKWRNEDYIYGKEQGVRDGKAQQVRDNETRRQETLNQTHNLLQNNHGYSPDDATAFINTFINPESLTLDDYVIIDKHRKFIANKQNVVDRTARELEDRRKMQVGPNPSNGGVGADPGSETKSDEVYF